MQRTLLLSALALLVSVGSFIGGLQAQYLRFSDVPTDHWASDAIAYVSDVGLMNGMDADTFAPNEPVTRAQLAMVLYRQRGDEAAVVPDEPFYDPPTADDDPVLGNPRATVTLIEFGDYQCPFCQRHFEQTLPLIKKHYIDTGKVKMVFRDFPLSFHSNAHVAAVASECADEQGAFWGMHDALFAWQDQWANEPDPTDVFVEFAADLKLDTDDFLACIDGGDMDADIENDAEDAGDAGVSGTPGFWILGPGGRSRQINGAYPYETFEEAFDSML